MRDQLPYAALECGVSSIRKYIDEVNFGSPVNKYVQYDFRIRVSVMGVLEYVSTLPGEILQI